MKLRRRTLRREPRDQAIWSKLTRSVGLPENKPEPKKSGEARSARRLRDHRLAMAAWWCPSGTPHPARKTLVAGLPGLRAAASYSAVAGKSGEFAPIQAAAAQHRSNRVPWSISPIRGSFTRESLIPRPLGLSVIAICTRKRCAGLGILRARHAGDPVVKCHRNPAEPARRRPRLSPGPDISLNCLTTRR
jgi:hypothetical protein